MAAVFPKPLPTGAKADPVDVHDAQVSNSLPPGQDYKRGTTTSVTIRTEVDQATGEIISQEETVTGRITREPDYVKLYLGTMMQFQGIHDVPVDFLVALSRQLTGYVNDSETAMQFISVASTKAAIAAETGLKVDMINKLIKRLVTSGVLIKTAYRGTYNVNPWLLARGKWKNISALRAHFNFIDGSWQVDASLSGETASDNKENDTTMPEPPDLEPPSEAEMDEALASIMAG